MFQYACCRPCVVVGCVTPAWPSSLHPVGQPVVHFELRIVLETLVAGVPTARNEMPRHNRQVMSRACQKTGVSDLVACCGRPCYMWRSIGSFPDLDGVNLQAESNVAPDPRSMFAKDCHLGRFLLWSRPTLPRGRILTSLSPALDVVKPGPR